MLQPFIHKFQSHNGYFYIYDVNTNEILHVDKAVHEIIDDFFRLSHADIISKWRNQYSFSEIQNAINAFDSRNKEGFFSAHRPKKMVAPYTDEELKKNLRSKVSHLILNISEKCNLRCRYCTYGGSYAGERKHSNNMMKRDIIEKALSFFVVHSGDTEDPVISFYGGEPLTAVKNITYAIHFLKNQNHNRKYDFVIDTNGTLLNDKIIDFISKHNIRLQVSIDGPAHIHDRYRVDIKKQPTFERIMGNLKLLRTKNEELYNKTSFSCTFCPSNSLVEINDFFENNVLVKNHPLNVSPVNPYDTTFIQSFTEEDYARQRQEANDLKRRYIEARINDRLPTNFERALFEKGLIQIHRRDLNKLGDIIGTNGCCQPGMRRMSVDPSGKLQICEKVGQTCYLGDVDNGIVMTKVKDMVDQYIAISESDCLKCWGFRLCGTCFAYAKKENQFDINRRREHCRARLYGIYDELMTYATIMEKNPNAFDFVKDMVIK